MCRDSDIYILDTECTFFDKLSESILFLHVCVFRVLFEVEVSKLVLAFPFQLGKSKFIIFIKYMSKDVKDFSIYQ